MVPRRGWKFFPTLNLAHPWALPLTLANVAVGIGVIRLVTGHGEWSMANLLIAISSIILAMTQVSHRLSKAPVTPDGNPPLVVRALIAEAIAFGLVALGWNRTVNGTAAAR